MKIIVAGVGKIGKTVVKHLSSEGHEVIVIDNDTEIVDAVVNEADVMGVVGNGLTKDTLLQAGIDKCDCFIASTKSDETNILCCMLAKSLGAKYTIARVRDYEFNQQVNIFRDSFGITLTINPELECAKEIFRILNFPSARRVDSFSEGIVELAEFIVPENSPMIGQKLFEMNKKNHLQALVCVVQRGEEVFIPKGLFEFQAKDRIYITCDKSESRAFVESLGMVFNKIKNILIVGGGKISMYLAQELCQNDYNVKIVENDKERCIELAEQLPKASIICGDGSDQRVLREEGMERSDAIVCLTGNDEENIIISLYANKKDVPKIVTKINKVSFGELMEQVEVASIIYPTEIAASQAVSYIRGISNRRGNNIKKLYKLVNNKVEAIEFEVSMSSKICNVSIKDLKLKPDILIAGIIRNGELIIPTGQTTINGGDSVIIVTTSAILNDLDDILL